MRLGIHVSSFATPFAASLRDTARAAEDGGAATLTLMDHWFQMEQLGGPSEPMLDGYTALGFVAGQTSRIELGLLVTGVTYRHPGLLAKTVATLDVLSEGRAMLGIGAAWYDREHLGLGVPFPDLSERFERLEEALQVCHQMWGPEEGPYDGAHYRLAETVCVPAPVHPPRVLIGGSGEQKTLRLVARYADACNLFGTDSAVIAHKLAVLDRHCQTEGRDPAEVQRTVIGGDDPLADVDAFLSSMEALAALGVEQVWTGPPPGEGAAWTERACAELVPRLAEIG